jgi:putative copper resistance protein D
VVAPAATVASATVIASVPAEAPSAATLLRPSVAPGFLVLSVLLLGGYVALVRARDARHRDHPWPRARTAWWVSGVAVVLVATQSGIARYDTSLFSVHMLQHLLLGMVAPLLLALAAPVTLALQGSSRSWQVALLHVLNHPVARVLTHPIVAWSLFSLSLFALYFTPLLDLAQRNGAVHAAVHLHFLAAGFLFCWSVVGRDVGHRRPSDAARLLAVVLTVPFHAILGLALHAGADNPLPAVVDAAAARDWGGSAAADQRTGAALLWAVGEVWGLVLVIIVAAGWMRDEARRQAREDVRLDAERAREAERGTAVAGQPQVP